MAEPNRHLEAITSRPLLLSAIAERTRHTRQTTLKVASAHAKTDWAASVLSGAGARFLPTQARSWLGGCQLPPPYLVATGLAGNGHINRLNARFEIVRLAAGFRFTALRATPGSRLRCACYRGQREESPERLRCLFHVERYD